MSMKFLSNIGNMPMNRRAGDGKSGRDTQGETDEKYVWRSFCAREGPELEVSCSLSTPHEGRVHLKQELTNKEDQTTLTKLENKCMFMEVSQKISASC